MDLADELMNDLENDSGEDNFSDTDSAALNGEPAASTSALAELDGGADEEGEAAVGEEMLVPEGGVRPAEELDQALVDAMELGPGVVRSVEQVAKLAGSRTMREVLQKIEHYTVNPDPNLSGDNDSAEYRLIVQANNVSVEIDNEMLIVHKFIRDHYTARFPELDSLVSAPLSFCRVILALGNGPELRGDIQGLLTSGAVMAVHVTAATSKGIQLAEAEWDIVGKACQMMFDLDDAKKKILLYVESRISLLAPNISTIVGTTTATKILGIAGGLHGLTRIPHSNIYLLGATKKASTGFSTASHSVDRLHTGFIYQCPLVQRTRHEDRMKAQRKVGAKVALAARVDMAGSSPNGKFGVDMLDKLEREMERLARPPPSKVTKALPRPDAQKKHRRGGQRARKAKEAFAQSELSKLQNRVKFGEAEEETFAFDESVGMGMIGSSSGRLRAGMGEARTKAKLSKAAKGRLGSIRTSAGDGKQTSGTASSISFTPVGGVELVDPSKMRAKVEEANAKWFADSGTFTHLKKEPGIGKPSGA